MNYWSCHAKPKGLEKVDEKKKENISPGEGEHLVDDDHSVNLKIVETA